MFRITLLTLALALLLPFSHARAEDARLDEQAIREHYKYARDVHKKPYEDFLSYLERSTADDAKITIENQITVGGGSPQTQTIIVNKADFLRLTSRSEHEQMRRAKATNNVDFIKIAPDGKSAIVRDNTSASGMIIPPGATQKMRFEQKASCAEKIVLKGNDIQLQRAVCKGTINLTP